MIQKTFTKEELEVLLSGYEKQLDKLLRKTHIPLPKIAAYNYEISIKRQCVCWCKRRLMLIEDEV